jgi:hypothetical protein
VHPGPQKHGLAVSHGRVDERQRRGGVTVNAAQEARTAERARLHRGSISFASFSWRTERFARIARSRDPGVSSAILDSLTPRQIIPQPTGWDIAHYVDVRITRVIVSRPLSCRAAVRNGWRHDQ